MQVFALVALVLALAPNPSPGQKFGKPNSLAPDLPSPPAVVEKMLQIARVKPGETVYDLGCGEGRIVIAAAQKFKANAVGVEISHNLYNSAFARVRALGLQDQVKILHDDLLNVDLSPADVVTLYLLTSSNDKLKPNLEKYLKSGARVVSHDFEFRGWKPTEIARVKTDGHVHTIYLYEMGKSR